MKIMELKDTSNLEDILVKDYVNTKATMVRYNEDLERIFLNKCANNLVIFYNDNSVSKQDIIKYTQTMNITNLILVIVHNMLTSLPEIYSIDSNEPGLYMNLKIDSMDLIRKSNTLTKECSSTVTVIPYKNIKEFKNKTFSPVLCNFRNRHICMELNIPENDYIRDKEEIINILLVSGYYFVSVNFRKRILTGPFDQ